MIFPQNFHTLPKHDLTTSWDRVFVPFKYLDLSSVYAAYAGIIDFFIYSLIFVAVAQVTLGRRFAGSGGRAISIGTGLTLAVAMLIAEKTFDFNIQSFGPLAVAIVILLLGIMIYKLLHHAGMGGLRAGSATYIALFLTALAVTPEFLGWIAEAMPLLGLALIIALVLAVFGAASLLWPSGRGGLEAKLRRTKAEPRPNPSDQETFSREAKYIKHRIRPITKKAVKGTETILKDLGSIQKAITQFGKNPEARRVIINQISRVMPKQHQVQIRIESVKQLSNRILRLDNAIFSNKLK